MTSQPNSEKNSVEETLNSIASLYNDGEMEKAVESGNALIEKVPNHPGLLNLMGAAHLALKQTSRAIPFFERAIIAAPNYAEAYNNAGAAHFSVGALAQAEQNYAKAVSLKPDYLEAYNNLGTLLRDKADFQGAASNFEKSLEIRPNSKSIRIELGKAYVNAGNLELGLENYRLALSLDPSDSDLLNLMGAVSRKLGDLDAAIAYYQEAIRHTPDFALAKLNMHRAKREAVPAWHVSMMNDSVRNKLFAEAIEIAVNEDDYVLEIGTGSGILSMIAASAGAEMVVSCESSKIISSIAQKVVSENGMSDKISVVSKNSKDLVVGSDLSRKADVLISEILSAEFVGEGVLSTIFDARQRLLLPGGRMVPESGKVKIALLGSSPEIADNLFSGVSQGFDLSAFNSVTPDRVSLHLTKEPLLLSEAKTAFSINLLELEDFKEKETLFDLKVNQDGLCLGLIQWMDVGLHGEIRYENRPGNIKSHWPNPIYMFEKPIEVESGRKLQVKGTLFRDSVWFDLVKK